MIIQYLILLKNLNKYIKNFLTNDDVTEKKNIKEYNPNWRQIHGKPYGVLIIGSSGLRKTNLLLYLKVIIRILIKSIYVQNIHLKQNINSHIKNAKG